MYKILSAKELSISEFKKYPMTAIERAARELLCISNDNKPTCYCVPPGLFEAMLDVVDDTLLFKVLKERENQEFIEDDL